MKAIIDNPYRVVGLLAGVSARDQERQIRRLRQFLQAEQEPEEDYSFSVFGHIERDIDKISHAVSKLNLNEDKINSAIFWFWNGNPITDEAAFDALKDGKIDVAYQIWDKLTIDTKEDGKRFWKPVNDKNYSAFHNLFVLEMIKPNRNLTTGIIANLFFLENDLYQKFIASISDETYKPNKKDLQLIFLEQLIKELDFQKTKLFDTIKKYSFSAKEDFQRMFIKNLIEPIESKIEISKTKRKDNKQNADKVGKELFESTIEDIKKLQLHLSSDESKYISITDKLANEILQCSIDFFNTTQENEQTSEYFEKSLNLAESARSIAKGSIVKDRIQENINTIEEIKYKEISQAILLLKSVQEAFDKNKFEILAEVKKQEASLSYGHSIDWTKVNRIIYDSIDWKKVVELILKVIPPANIEKIKNVDKPSKRIEYIRLVNFLFEHLSNTQKNKIKHICFWDMATSSSPNSSNLPGNNSNHTNSETEFSFSENAWWILGLVGLIIGATNGDFFSAIIGAFIGAGIGLRFSN